MGNRQFCRSSEQEIPFDKVYKSLINFLDEFYFLFKFFSEA